MYHSFIQSILLQCMMIQLITAFDSGFLGDESTTHTGITRCALLRIAARYLKTAHHSNRLDRIANSSDLCDNTQQISNEIAEETRRLGVASELNSAIDSICTSNIQVNVEEFNSPRSHFHNEQFTEGSRLVQSRLVNAENKLHDETASIAEARHSFGQALHTLQDFYAHSNWLELGKIKTNQAIGTDRRLGNYVGRGKKTCRKCTDSSCSHSNILDEIPSGQYLTSGYFNVNRTTSIKPPGKCSHGGPIDQTILTDAMGYGINKDNVYSDHGLYHWNASKIALVATLEKLEELWAAVGNDTFARFLGFYSTDFVITMDTTGSMGSVISFVKSLATGIIDFTRGNYSMYRPSKYIFSPFNDPGWGPLTVTTDPQVLIDLIEKLNVTGGDDEPELFYHGLYDALQVCQPNSIIYTFTDASAKDGILFPQVLARAIELNVRVISFYVRKTGKSNQQRQRRTVPHVLDGSTDDNIATATGGTTIGLNPSRDVNATIALVTHHLIPRQSLLAIQGLLTMNTTLFITRNTSLFNIELTSSQVLSVSTSNSLTLIDPAGTIRTPIAFASSNYFLLYQIENPMVGQWILSSTQSSSHRIEVTIPETSNNAIIIMCTSRLSHRIIYESPNAYAPLLTAPFINQKNLVVVTTCTNLPSPVRLVTIVLIDQPGSTISVFHTNANSTNRLFVTPVTIPDRDFRILTKVQLTDGSIVQRQSAALITPTTISITIKNQPYVVSNNSAMNVTFALENRASQDTWINLCALDTLQLLGPNGTCQNYSVANMSTIDDILYVPTDLLDADNITTGSITFTITTINHTERIFKNFKKMSFYVQSQASNDTNFDEDETTRVSSSTMKPIASIVSKINSQHPMTMVIVTSVFFFMVASLSI